MTEETGRAILSHVRIINIELSMITGLMLARYIVGPLIGIPT